MMDKAFEKWLSRAPIRQEQRQQWAMQVKEKLIPKLCASLKDFVVARRKLDRFRSEQRFRCLQQATIIGVTSTGLARNLELLRRLSSKVIVIEEAGELLESHTITSFLPSVEHVILIGDHMQLRPKVDNYELSRESRQGAKYSLDVSLFERLVMPTEGYRAVKLKFSTLETQRRMHPSISRLIRKELYPSLQDSPQVNQYPEVNGMKRRLFWLDHAEFEGGADDEQTTTHWNEHEIDMTVALVSHLIKQGTYSSENLAVLTPYLGQLQRLRERMQSQFEIVVSDRDEEDLVQKGLEITTSDSEEIPVSTTAKISMAKAIRLATVDNFQGEEAQVVVISLVRSNREGKVGFLRTSNRINVLLSRAKHGMYIIGNATTARTVPFWDQTLRTLEAEGLVGTSLELACPRHPNTPIQVSNPEDFAMFSPEGGCKLPCHQRLECGHVCVRACHSDVMHAAVRCLEPCPKQLKCKHVCPKQCWQPCEKDCKVPIGMADDFALPCGHHIDTLECRYAEEPDRYKCKVRVTKVVPGCLHSIETDCHVKLDAQDFKCNARCSTPLPCGHTCNKACHLCRKKYGKTDHTQCDKVCGRDYACGHSCRKKCHGEIPCPPCEAPCATRCSHSRCPKPCSAPCAPCVAEDCTNRCDHGNNCSMPCAAPCNNLPCSERCDKLLDCGHQCPSLCSEPCPGKKFCQVCSEDTVKDQVVDQIEHGTYREINLEESPVIVAPCGHLYTVQTLDGWMEMSTHYEVEGHNIKAILATSTPFSVKEMKACMYCRGFLGTINRYSRILRRAFLDEVTKKFISDSNSKLAGFMERYYDEQDNLAKTPSAAGSDITAYVRPYLSGPIVLQGLPDQQMNRLRKFGARRHADMLKLHGELWRFKKQVSVDEQPFKRVHDRVETLRAQGGTVDELKMQPELIQTGMEVKVHALLVRCELFLIQDTLEVRKEGPAHPLMGDISVNLKRNVEGCEKLIAAAQNAFMPLQLTEGHIFAAQYIALWMSYVENDKRNELRGQGEKHITEAEEAMKKISGSTSGLREMIDAVNIALNGGVFYQPVTSDEMRAVYQAMRTEFLGTGHWYTCVNGHPFTVGECGMPMQQALCPECGEHVGGAHHQPVEGVQRAESIEQQFGRLNID
ncbi:hypothetical protein BT63DRAFT_180528 [Microthyrium microscopicum]|uniref:RZ-type domain-containing protein n=1 Tax=Microthyrium microscopicum TaxID=703497 RepID=A0A6A6UHZ6_9PEZI|nr:hypothetical protein BT63DRAFT_180528 [Microthyrium microscopicum]